MGQAFCRLGNRAAFFLILVLFLPVGCGGGGASETAGPASPAAPATSGTPVTLPAARANDLPYPGDGILQPLRDRADAVVIGDVLQVTARREESPGGFQDIYSHIVVSVDETLKGSAPPSLFFRSAGGEFDGVRQTFSHHPALFVPGERVLLFLAKTSQGYEIVGGETGKLVLHPTQPQLSFSDRQVSLAHLRRILR